MLPRTWTDILRNNTKFSSVRYSPCGRYAMNAETEGGWIIFRVVSLRTLQCFDYTPDDSFNFNNVTVVECYWLNQTEFVLVFAYNSRPLYEQRKFHICHENRTIETLEKRQINGCTANVCRKYGSEPLVIGTNRYFVLAIPGQLILCPWDIREETDTINVNYNAVPLDGYFHDCEFFFKGIPFCYGSKLYMSAYTNIKDKFGRSEAKKYTNTLICLDLTNLDVTETNHHLNQGHPEWSLIKLNELVPSDYICEELVISNQYGNKLVTASHKLGLGPNQESRQNIDITKVFITDLENLTTIVKLMILDGVKKGTIISIHNEQIVIWRNNSKARTPLLQYSIESLPKGRVLSLKDLTLQFLIKTEEDSDEDADDSDDEW